MEKSIVETERQQQHPSQTYPPQTFPPAIHRKPLPRQSAAQTTATVGDAATTAQADIHPPASAHIPPRTTPARDSTIQDQTPEHESKQPTPSPQEHKHIHESKYDTALPPRPIPQSFPHRLKAHWRRLSKRRRVLLLTPLLLLLLLIIILAATLSHHSRFSNLPLPSSHGGPYTGDLTYYEPGLGACGVTSTSADFIVAVSHTLYDAVSTGSNPNANPLCGRKIRASRGGKSVDLTVVDRCVGCQPRDLDVSVTVFGGLADVDLGRVLVSWAWLEDVPGAVA